MRVGVLSDTHGLLRPRVLELLAGCERLLHAGDVGDIGDMGDVGDMDGMGSAGHLGAAGPAGTAGDVGAARAAGGTTVLAALRRIAPVEAVRGNVDGAASGLPPWQAGDLAGLPFHLVHRREDVDPAWMARSRLIVYGHSHRPEIAWHGRCLLLNPGACGQRRFHLPLTLAILTVAGNRIVPEILAVE